MRMLSECSVKFHVKQTHYEGKVLWLF